MTWKRTRSFVFDKQARPFGDQTLDNDPGRGHVIDKVNSLTGDYRGDVEVAGLGGCRVSRRLRLDLLQQVDLAPEPVIGMGVPRHSSGERRRPPDATRASAIG